MQRNLLAILASILISAYASSAAAAEISDSVTLIINFEASPEGHSDFEEIMNSVPEAMKSEEGFVSATV